MHSVYFRVSNFPPSKNNCIIFSIVINVKVKLKSIASLKKIASILYRMFCRIARAVCFFPALEEFASDLCI